MFQKINLIKRGDNLRRKNLIKLRVELNLKAQEMAKKLGISRVHYSNIENGKVDPTYEFIEKAEKILGVKDVWELFKKGE